MLTCENKAHSVFAKFPSISKYVKDVLVFTPLPFKSIHAPQLHHFPNGYSGIYIQQQDNSLQLQVQSKLFSLPKLFLYGQNTFPKKSIFKIRHKLIIIHLHPESLKLLFKVDPSHWIDEYIDLVKLNDPIIEAFYNRFYSHENLNDQLTIIAHLIEQKAKDAGPVKYGKSILNLIEQQPSLTVSELSKKLCTTPRTLQRVFKSQLGLPPSTYFQIVQFKKTLKALHAEPAKPLSQIAYENDYTDQSHFTRAFKKYTNFTPAAFLRMKNSNSFTFYNPYTDQL